MNVNDVKTRHVFEGEAEEASTSFWSRFPIGEVSEMVVFLHGINICVNTVNLVRPLGKSTGDPRRVPNMENAGM